MTHRICDGCDGWRDGCVMDETRAGDGCDGCDGKNHFTHAKIFTHRNFTHIITFVIDPELLYTYIFFNLFKINHHIHHIHHQQGFHPSHIHHNPSHHPSQSRKNGHRIGVDRLATQHLPHCVVPEAIAPSPTYSNQSHRTELSLGLADRLTSKSATNPNATKPVGN